MKLAQSLIDTHSGSGQIEVEITLDNQKQIVPLFKEFKLLGFSPKLEERKNSSFLVVSVSDCKRVVNNVISINIAEQKNAKVIEVDFVNRKRK